MPAHPVGRERRPPGRHRNKCCSYLYIPILPCRLESRRARAGRPVGRERRPPGRHRSKCYSYLYPPTYPAGWKAGAPVSALPELVVSKHVGAGEVFFNVVVSIDEVVFIEVEFGVGGWVDAVGVAFRVSYPG